MKIRELQRITNNYRIKRKEHIMLSKLDIDKELGKSISIYPLNRKNFKENSINLTAGLYAWTLENGTIFFNPKQETFSLDKISIEFKRIQL